MEQIADELEDDVEKIRPMYNLVVRFALEYDEDAILNELRFARI